MTPARGTRPCASDRERRAGKHFRDERENIVVAASLVVEPGLAREKRLERQERVRNRPSRFSSDPKPIRVCAEEPCGVRTPTVVGETATVLVDGSKPQG